MDDASMVQEGGEAELQALRDGAKAAFVIQLVAMTTGVSAREIAGGKRARNPAARARWLAMYLLHTTLGLPLMRVGAVFGRDRTTVGQALGRIEDWRSHPAFEEMLSGLERCVLAAPMEVAPRVLDMGSAAERELRA